MDHRTYNTAYNRRRNRAIAAGTWQGRRPIGPTLAHVDELRRRGMTVKQIAAAAGVAPGTLLGLYRAGRTIVNGDTAAAIAAVTWEPRRGPYVDSTGPARRLQALTAIGYSFDRLSREVGTTRYVLNQLAGGKQASVTLWRAEQIRAVYDRLSMLPGPSSRSRGYAARRGWVPPLAWDDELIDDPTASPAPAPLELVDQDDDEVEQLDHAKVALALAGRLAWRELAPIEKTAVLEQLARRHSDGAIAELLATTAGAIFKWRERDGIAPHKPCTRELTRAA